MQTAKMTVDKKMLQHLRVFVRTRPPNKNEVDSKSRNIVGRIAPHEIQVKSGYNLRTYTFDHVFRSETSQLDVYNVVVNPYIESVIAGYNCTIFGFGQTGTGKTHTIIGENPLDSSADFVNNSNSGMIPRAAAQFFWELCKLNPKIEYTVRVSFVYIYNEEIRDLLCDHLPLLRICEEPGEKGSVYIKGLREVTVNSIKDVLNWLYMGTKNRTKGESNHNFKSAYAHTIFVLTVHTREVGANGEEVIKTGRLRFVDLASSENIVKSAVTQVRAREAATINKSIVTFGKVIKAMEEKVLHIPYRDSKLTRIFQDSLGGHSKACMIATISLSFQFLDETVNTLEYARMARCVVNHPQTNVKKDSKYFIKELKDEMTKLRQELTASRTGHGFYVRGDTYETMAQKIDNDNKRLLELIREVRTIEQCKLSKEQEFENLKDAFAKSKTDLNRISAELDQVTEKVKQDEQVLTRMKEQDTELSETANILLKVCETSTKREAIYFTKYGEQWNATLKNANAAERIAKTTVSVLDKVQEEVVNGKLNCLTVNEEGMASAKILTKDHMANLKQIKQLSSYIQSNRARLNLNVAQPLQDDKENFQDYLGNNFNTNLLHLQTQSQIIIPLEALKDEMTQNVKIDTIIGRCFNKVHDGIAQNTACATTAKKLLQKTSASIRQNSVQVQDHMSKVAQYKTVIDDHMSHVGEEQRMLMNDSSKFKQMMSEQLNKVRSCQEKEWSEDLGDSLTDFLQHESEIMLVEMAIIKDVISEVRETEGAAQNQLDSEIQGFHKYIADMTGAIKENLNKYNGELKSVAGSWLNQTNAIKENLLEAGFNNTKTIKRTLDGMSHSLNNYNSKIKVTIEQSINNLRRLETNIAPAHVGDSPIKTTNVYPREIQKSISRNKLLEQFGSVAEGSSAPD